MISLRMSTGRSSSLKGPLLAFSFPFRCFAAVSLDGGDALVVLVAPTPETLSQSPSASAWVDIVCALSRDGGEVPVRSSSKGYGEAGLGVPGAESGDSDAMLFRDTHVS